MYSVLPTYSSIHQAIDHASVRPNQCYAIREATLLHDDIYPGYPEHLYDCSAS